LIEGAGEPQSVEVTRDSQKRGLGFDGVLGDMVGTGGLQDHDPGEQVVEVGGDEFLVDEINAFGVEVFGLEMAFDGFEEFLLSPTQMVEVAEFVRRVLLGAAKCGDEDEGIFGLGEPDLEDPQWESKKLWVLFEKILGRLERDDSIPLSGLEEGTDFLELAILGQPHKKFDAPMDDLVEEPVCGKTPVHDQQVTGTEVIEEFHREVPLGGIEGASDEVDGELGQHVEQDGGDHLGKVGPLGGSEVLPEFLAVREVLLGAIDAEDSHALPEQSSACGSEGLRRRDPFVEQIFQNSQGELLSGAGKGGLIRGFLRAVLMGVAEEPVNDLLVAVPEAWAHHVEQE
jgi:hypothetical protein